MKLLEMKTLETEPCQDLPSLLPCVVISLLPGGQQVVPLVSSLQILQILPVLRPGQQPAEPPGLGELLLRLDQQSQVGAGETSLVSQVSHVVCWVLLGSCPAVESLVVTDGTLQAVSFS